MLIAHAQQAISHMLSSPHLGECVRSLSELIERPGQHGRARLMAGQQEGLNLVAQLCLQRGTPCAALGLQHSHSPFSMLYIARHYIALHLPVSVCGTAQTRHINLWISGWTSAILSMEIVS